MRVIISGSHKIHGATAVYERLGDLPTDTTIVQGGALGVDNQACQIAQERDWKCETFEADWRGLGSKAGPIRNQQMVDSGADLVIAFPGPSSIGTWDLINRAKKANIPVEIIKLY